MPRGIKRGSLRYFPDNTALSTSGYRPATLSLLYGRSSYDETGGLASGLREELRLTRIGIERFTSKAASRDNNERYRIRRGRLTEIEEGNATESAEELGVPAVVRQRLDASQFRLGIIALTDDTMDDLVPGGSVVVIDKSHNAVEMGNWKTIQERPIYFVWHDQGYSCSWCHLVHDTLLIVPHPTSRQPVMVFKMRRAAIIIGRIVHVWPPMIIPKNAA
jgi:hypothetical protein